jgi:hypothetical protein
MYSSARENNGTELRRRTKLKTLNFLPTKWNVFRTNPKSVGEKAEQSKNIRVLLGYFVLFILGIASLFLMQLLVGPRLTTTSDEVFQASPWVAKMEDTRHEDVINHHYDNFAVSILLPEAEFDNDAIHPSVTTFLKQINHLQVCNNMVAHTFIGGKKQNSIPFFQQAPELPRLERYIDGFLSMLEFAPNQDWFIQIDQSIFI